MQSAASDDVLRTGEWRADRASGELAGPDGLVRVEPKVMDLLFLLSSRAGEVVGREAIMAALWPGVVVGEDSLARTVSKLRTAIGDDARAPRYLETIAKRGYRWLAPVERDAPRAVAATTAEPRAMPWAAVAIGVLVAAGIGFALVARRGEVPAPPAAATPSPTAELLARADDAYFQFSRADNEAAIELYQRVMGLSPDDPAAMAGLANALVQRALRWPQVSGSETTEFRRLEDALANGHLAREPQRAQVERARLLAERAVALAPDSSAAYKALGFVASAQRRFDDALAAYARAVALDPDAWGAMINIGDVLGITERDAEAIAWFERAYEAMERVYAESPAQVRPWQAPLGVLVAKRHAARGERADAEAWYQRVLANSPLDPPATAGLAALLREGGDAARADRLCDELRQRTNAACP